MNLINQLVDDKNNWVWKSITEKYVVNVTIWNENFSEVYSINGSSEIRLHELNKDAFNHELCHLYFNTIVGSYYHRLKISLPEELRNFVSLDCLVHIGNCIEHNIFYDLYLSLGSLQQNFLSDFNQRKGNHFQSHIETLTLHNIDFYLGNLFSVISDKNKKFDYTNEVMGALKINPKVFKACLDLLIKSKEIGIETQKDDFEYIDSKLIINNTHNNLCYNFWEIIKVAMLE